MKRILSILLVTSVASIGVYSLNNQELSAVNTAAGKKEIVKTETEPQLNSNSIAQTGKIDRIETTSDFLTIYNTYDALSEDAHFIIEGTVLESESFDFLPNDAELPTVLTKSKVKVSNSFSSILKAGEIITIIEPGGITTKKAIGMDKKFNLPKEKWNDKIEIIHNGVNTMKKNENVLLFVGLPDPGVQVVDEEHYWLIGANQGKFKLKNDVYSREVTNQMDKEYQALPVNKEDLKQKIKLK